MFKSLFILSAIGANLLALTQSSVPSDLSSDFDPNSIALQVSYSQQSDEGFKDGTKFTSQQTTQTPSFALGDSSGVNTALNFLVMMLDTTNDGQRVLHYMHSNFKATEDKTGIASNAQPIQAYKAPGSLGDTGLRKYSFLLYAQPRTSFSPTGMPSLGSIIDVEDFQSKNNLQPALAGVGMQVQVSGGSTGSQSSAAPLPPPVQTSPPPPPPVAVTPPVQQSPAPLATASVVVPSVSVPAVSVPTLSAVSSLVSQASQAVDSASVAASSAIASASAAVMTLTSSAAGAASSAAASGANASIASGSASSGATPTSSSPPVQSSSGAAARSGSALASLPLFVLIGALIA